MLTLEEGRQCKLLSVLETLVQEETMARELAAKEYVHRLPVIWSNPLSDYQTITGLWHLTNFFSLNRLCSDNYIFFLRLHTIYNTNITYATNTSYNTTNYYLQYLQLLTIRT